MVPGMSASEKPEVTVPADTPPSYQLELEDIVVGEGEVAVPGRIVEVHYVGVSWKNKQAVRRVAGTAATRSSSASARARSSPAGTRAWPG